MPRLSKNTAGYTLIEILVGLTIIGIIFGVGFVSFRDFSRRQALAGGAKSLTADLRLTQEQALAGKKPDDVKCTAGSLSGIGFRILSADSYRVEAICSGGTVIIKTTTISSGLTISASSAGGSLVNPIIFKPIGQGTNIPSGDEMILTLTQAGTRKIVQVFVSSGGGIE